MRSIMSDTELYISLFETGETVSKKFTSTCMNSYKTALFWQYRTHFLHTEMVSKNYTIVQKSDKPLRLEELIGKLYSFFNSKDTSIKTDCNKDL